MNRFKIIKQILWFMVAVSGLLTSCTGESVKTITFNTDIAEDATPAVLKAVLGAKQNSSSEFKFEKGTYHFYPDKALQKYCFISNHCDLMVRTAFSIRKIKERHN